MKPTTTQFDAFQRIFEYFNSKLFDQDLPNLILNFSRKNQIAGYFANDSWKHIQGEKVHEISINPSTLSRGKKYVLQTLVHEMCHLWQHEFGKPSRTGYHNKEWAAKMELIGLMPSSTEMPGGKKTGQKMSDYIIPGGPLESIINEMPKELWLPFKSMEYLTADQIQQLIDNSEEESFAELIEVNNSKKKKNKSKYSCPDCGINLWGKNGLQVLCIACDVELIEIEQ